MVSKPYETLHCILIMQSLPLLYAFSLGNIFFGNLCHFSLFAHHVDKCSPNLY